MGELVTRAFFTPVVVLVVALLAQPATIALAQAPTGSIVGVVRDSAGLRLAQVIVGIAGRTDAASRAQTDDSGSYRLTAVSLGATRLLARRVGYAPETLSVVVAAGEPTRVDVIMAAAIDVLPMEVVTADPTRGKMGPFNRRKSRGVGAFVTRAEIEKRQPGSMSEMLRYLPGVSVTQKMAGEPQPVHMQRSVNSSMQSTCVVQLYVDGHPYPNGNIDDFSPVLVEGVEVYRSASEIPADFRTRDATCGLIALWTRDPEAARRKP